MSADWFRTWFNTKYYHILYKNRNESEAALFLDNLLKHLQLPNGSGIWDMACGKGRHALYLAEKGFNALGTDISENSIKEADALCRASDANACSRASFYVHDMRTPFRINYFDCVLNIFTSMGYFKFIRDDERVFLSAYKSLKQSGYFVVDFLNADKVLNTLVASEEKIGEGIRFKIARRLEGKTLIKEIVFDADGEHHAHQERVLALTVDDLTGMADNAGFELKAVFGDYDLNRFDKEKSDRVILILKK